MPIFRHHHEPPKRAEWVPGLAEAATAQGWQAIDGVPFIADLHNAIRDLTCALYGFQPNSYPGAIGETSYTDAFRGHISGRIVTVANAFTFIEPGLFQAGTLNPWAAVCAVELPTLVSGTTIVPRHLPPETRWFEVTTGDPAFDQTYRTTSAADIQALLTPDVRVRIMSRDDWAFTFQDYLFACVGKGRYQAVGDVTARIIETLTLLADIPESVLPRQVDHSADDLVVRINRLAGIEDAMIFLQQLTPAERQQLAQSNTPLARFADVTSPADALTRFNALDMSERMQLLAMFQRVNDGDR